MKADCTIVLQAGGSSSRMGQDKANVLFNGEPLILRIVTMLLRSFNNAGEMSWLLITNGDRGAYAFLDEILPLEYCADRMPGWGALGGLLTAFSAAQTTFVAVVACDLPFADGALLENGLDTLISTGEDIFIPRTPAGLEPMHAVYRRETCLAATEHAIHNLERKAISWLGEVRTHYFDTTQETPFINVNTPQELRRAEALAREIESNPDDKPTQNWRNERE